MKFRGKKPSPGAGSGGEGKGRAGGRRFPQFGRGGQRTGKGKGSGGKDGAKAGVTIARDEYIPPSQEVALEYRSEHHPGKMFQGEKIPFELNLDSATMGRELGVGMSLYFITLRYLGVVMFLLFFLCVPTIVINNLASYEGEYSQFYNETSARQFESFSLSSLSFGTIMQSSREEHNPLARNDKYMRLTDDFYIEKEHLLYAAMATDFVGTLLFVCFVLILNRKITATIKQVDEDTIELSDYSVVVTGLPKDIDDPEEIRCFFELKYGKVVEVHLARNDGKLLNIYRQRGKTSIQLERARALHAKRGKGGHQITKLEQRRDAIDKKLKLIKSRRYFKTVQAFVTFNSEESRMKCILDSPSGAIGKFLQPLDKRFRGQFAYTVHEAPAASDILYENIEHKWYKKSFRRFAVNLLVFVLLLVSFFGTAYLYEEERKAGEKTDFNTQQLDAGLSAYRGMRVAPSEATSRLFCEDVLLHVGGNMTTPATTVNIVYGMACGEEDQREDLGAYFQQCYSSRDPLSGISVEKIVEAMRACYNPPAGSAAAAACSDLMLNSMPCYCKGLTAIPTTRDNYEIVQTQCKEYLSAQMTALILKYAAVALIATINACMKTIMKLIAPFELWDTHTQMEMSIMVKSYVAQLLNTAIISLIVGADLPEIHKYLKGTPLEGMMFAGDYRDFDSNWYTNVGNSITIALLVNSIVPRFVAFGQEAGKYVQRHFLKNFAITQKEMNDIFLGTQFDISKEYAETFMVISTAQIYGSGMPVMYLIASLAMVMKFSMDRWIVLRCCRQPTRLGPNLAKASINILTTGIILHLLFGMWIHSHFVTQRIDQTVTSVSGMTLDDVSGAISDQGLAGEGGGGAAPGPPVADLAAGGMVNITAATEAAASESITLQLPERTDAGLNILARGLQTNAFPLGVLLVLVLVGKIVYEVLVVGLLGKVLYGFLISMGFLKGKSASLLAPDGLPEFETAFQNNKLRGLTSYSIKENPKYKDAFYTTARERMSKLEQNSTDDIDLGDVEAMLGTAASNQLGPGMGGMGGGGGNVMQQQMQNPMMGQQNMAQMMQQQQMMGGYGGY